MKTITRQSVSELVHSVVSLSKALSFLPFSLPSFLPSPSLPPSPPGLGSPAQRIAAIAARVKELPDPNYFTLKALVKHFRKLVQQYYVVVDLCSWQNRNLLTFTLKKIGTVCLKRQQSFYSAMCWSNKSQHIGYHGTIPLSIT